MKKDRHAGSAIHRQQFVRLAALMFLALTASSCTDMGTAPQQGLFADHSGIADPVQRWEAY
ncbi:MAG TPA: hypothetical protein VK569_10130, partial [Bacteroidota bacterium]|nr:hypothetical protein [Bacteroidota bacterium]